MDAEDGGSCTRGVHVTEVEERLSGGDLGGGVRTVYPGYRGALCFVDFQGVFARCDLAVENRIVTIVYCYFGRDFCWHLLLHLQRTIRASFFFRPTPTVGR